MGKLTIYLPDDLAERVRAADLDTAVSRICQLALLAELEAPKVSIGAGGWCRVKLPEAELMVRFADQDGQLVVREMVTAATAVSEGLVRTLPLQRLLTWANGPVREGLLLAIAERLLRGSDSADDRPRGEAARRVEWGTEPEAEAGLADLLVVP